jgi:hypothetical protein
MGRRVMNKTCDHSGVEITSDKSTTELVHFQLGAIRDSHAAYDLKTKNYTIVQDGLYTVQKFYRAGDVIESPILVTNRELK